MIITLLSLIAIPAQAAIIDFTPAEITNIERKLVKKAECRHYGSEFDDQVQVTVRDKIYFYGICQDGPGSAYIDNFERSIKDFAGGPSSGTCLKWERCWAPNQCERQYGNKIYSKFSMRLFVDANGAVDVNDSHRVADEWRCE